MPLTIDEMIAQTEQIAKEACAEAGVDYEEFMSKLDALLGE